jgi:hypothetical protein
LDTPHRRADPTATTPDRKAEGEGREEKKGATDGQPNEQAKEIAGGRGHQAATVSLAAAGIVIQIASGAEYPTIPPGLIILLAAAGLVALATRWRWTTIVGVIVSLLHEPHSSPHGAPQRETHS